MTDHISRLPSDVVKHLARYLDYNSRVDFNTVVTPECRVVKKINSDAHNLHVKVSLVNHKLSKIRQVIEDDRYSYKHALLLIDLYRYMIDTKDNVIIELRSIEYRNTILIGTEDLKDLCDEFDVSEKMKLYIMRLAILLEKKIEVIPFRKKVKAELVQIL